MKGLENALLYLRVARNSAVTIQGVKPDDGLKELETFIHNLTCHSKFLGTEIIEYEKVDETIDGEMITFTVRYSVDRVKIGPEIYEFNYNFDV